MITYKIIVSYDGTNYFGWQRQPNKITISGILEDRFESVFKQKINIKGASRTDAGVHAVHQVAQFNANIDIDKERLLNIYNNSLPKDIIIKKIDIISDDFHVRKNVSMKTYHYHIFKKRPSIFHSKFGYYYPDLDVDHLKKNLQVFLGEHDFRSFCTGYEKDCTIRTIEYIDVKYIPKWQAYRVEIKSKGFLRHMVRRIVGGALDLRFNKTDLINIIKAKNNNQNIVTAPAQGLMLYKVNYKIKEKK